MWEIKMEGTLETEYGELDVCIKWCEEDKRVLIDLRPIDAEQVTSLVEEALRWKDGLLNGQGSKTLC
tara:strand:- start:566 stop:766 length:201 start_codon:yes stop_codon:yes gene_type:complete